ncbi:MAG: serine/threonine protein kinase [Planctomycetales bacterium]|nr:serine/threonine protein kinase [Planctomycetales bacterium]
MDKTRWQTAKQLFQAAVKLSPAERKRFIQDEIRDEDLRADVEQLLNSLCESGYLNSPIASVDEYPAANAMEGKQLGEFRLIRRIGAGGMGLVYEAEQLHPSRRAAVKILLPSNSLVPEQSNRFLFEAEILGNLVHPGIVRIFSAGNSDIGFGQTPWFAMELLSGVPLHDLPADELGLEQKLELLTKVCDAVQYAHQQGVIHRDLKPGNILVERTISSNSQPSLVPKLVDFGIARVLDGELGNSLMTAQGDVLGTLAYMSPEQLSGQTDSVDERSDIFSLGIIGYELLAGVRPFQPTNHTFAEYMRCRESSDPIPLSKVRAEFAGDLDAIFGQAIAHNPMHRYSSAAALAEDIRCFLSHRPISARRPSLYSRSVKYAKRNATLVGGAAATVAASLIGIILFAVEAQHARRESRLASYEKTKVETVNEFLTNDFMMNLIGAANSHGGERLPVEQLIDESLGDLSTLYADRPAVEAAIRNEAGTIYYNVGAVLKAKSQYELAHELFESSVGSEHYDTFETLNNIGLCHLRLGQAEEAVPLFRTSLAGQIRLLGELERRTLHTMNNLASALRACAGDSDSMLSEAESLLRRAIECREQTSGKVDRDRLTYLAGLGTLLISQGRSDEALTLHQEVYVNMTDLLGKNHVTSLTAGSRYAQTLYETGQLQQAEQTLTPVLSGLVLVHGESHPSTLTNRRLLSRIYRDMDNFESAQQQLNLAEEAATKLGGNQEILAKIRRDLNRLEARRNAR